MRCPVYVLQSDRGKEIVTGAAMLLMCIWQIYCVKNSIAGAGRRCVLDTPAMVFFE